MDLHWKVMSLLFNHQAWSQTRYWDQTAQQRESQEQENKCVCVFVHASACVCACVCVCVVISGVASDNIWYLELTFLILRSRLSHEWISLDERRRSMSNSKRDCRLILAKLKYLCGFLKSSTKHRLCVLLNLVEIGSSKHTARVCNLRESKLICHQARI